MVKKNTQDKNSDPIDHFQVSTTVYRIPLVRVQLLWQGQTFLDSVQDMTVDVIAGVHDRSTTKFLLDRQTYHLEIETDADTDIVEQDIYGLIIENKERVQCEIKEHVAIQIIPYRRIDKTDMEAYRKFLEHTKKFWFDRMWDMSYQFPYKMRVKYNIISALSAIVLFFGPLVMSLFISRSAISLGREDAGASFLMFSISGVCIVLSFCVPLTAAWVMRRLSLFLILNSKENFGIWVRVKMENDSVPELFEIHKNDIGKKLIKKRLSEVRIPYRADPSGFCYRFSEFVDHKVNWNNNTHTKREWQD